MGALIEQIEIAPIGGLTLNRLHKCQTVGRETNIQTIRFARRILR